MAVTRGRVAFALTALSCAWLIWLIPAAAIVPSGTEETGNSAGVISRSSTTLVESDGPHILALLAIPAVLGLLVWAGLHRQCSGRGRPISRLAWWSVGLLVALGTLGIASIGLFILPAGLTLGLAATLAPSPDS